MLNSWAGKEKGIDRMFVFGRKICVALILSSTQVEFEGNGTAVTLCVSMV